MPICALPSSRFYLEYRKINPVFLSLSFSLFAARYLSYIFRGPNPRRCRRFSIRQMEFNEKFNAFNIYYIYIYYIRSEKDGTEPNGGGKSSPVLRCASCFHRES